MLATVLLDLLNVLAVFAALSFIWLPVRVQKAILRQSISAFHVQMQRVRQRSWS